MKFALAGLIILGGGLLYVLAAPPPKEVDNLCKLFKEKPSWYHDAEASAKRWNSTIPIMMAIMHQESRFVKDAKPPRRKILWVIPGPRLSDAYGYAQARDSTWEWYMKDTDNWAANRRDFADAIDFVGWYNHKSHRIAKISKRDPYNLYLAYHDGQGGFIRKSYASKQWLLNVATRVARRAGRYEAQLQSCQADLRARPWWQRF